MSLINTNNNLLDVESAVKHALELEYEAKWFV